MPGYRQTVTQLAAFAGLFFASLVALGETPSDRFTAQRVFDVEYVDDPQISPSGETIVYVRRSMDRRRDVIRGDLWRIDADGGNHRPLVTGGSPAGTPRWSPDGRKLLYTTSSGGKPELRVRYMASGDDFALAQFEQAPSNAVWSPDGKHIAFDMFTPGKGPSFATAPAAPEGAEWSPPVRVFDELNFRFDGAGYAKPGTRQVYVIPADGGSPRQITHSETHFVTPAWLDNDTLLVVGNDAEDPELDPIESEIYAVELSDLSRRALTQRDGPDSNPLAAPNGQQIAYLGFDDLVKSYQQVDLYVLDVGSDTPRNLTADFDRSIGPFRWRSDGRGVIAQVENNGVIELVSITLQGQVSTLVSGLGGTSIGRPYAAASFSVSDGRRPILAYTIGTALRPAELGVKAAGEPRVLTQLNEDALAHLSLAKVEELNVASSHDDRNIQAWVALPPDFKPDGSFPLVLEIHGGPFTMYGPFFSAEIQRYAAEGYVTVYVNPRGSTGYGEAFAHLIDLNYPGEDFDDLMSVVDALVERRYADPKRLFVTGGSGGGILTAWIVGKTDRFAAAASIKPVINWMTMALSADIAAFVRRHWIRADPWSDPDAFLSRSPITLVGNIKTPTLVMVGEEDWRTPTWEAEQFYTALKLRKIDTALIRVPKSSHFIAGRPSRLIAKTDNIIGWFKRYDPQQDATAEADSVDE